MFPVKKDASNEMESDLDSEDLYIDQVQKMALYISTMKELRDIDEFNDVLNLESNLIKAKINVRKSKINEIVTK